MVAENGAIDVDREVIAIAGTGSGADTEAENRVVGQIVHLD